MKEQLSSYYMTPRPAPSKRPYKRGRAILVDRVNTILWLYWDPIGCGVPLDEYRHVAEELVALKNPTVDDIWGHLSDYEYLSLGAKFSNQKKIAVAAPRVIEAIETHT